MTYYREIINNLLEILVTYRYRTEDILNRFDERYGAATGKRYKYFVETVVNMGYSDLEEMIKINIKNIQDLVSLIPESFMKVINETEDTLFGLLVTKINTSDMYQTESNIKSNFKTLRLNIEEIINDCNKLLKND
jgi:hypothetical protein